LKFVLIQAVEAYMYLYARELSAQGVGDGGVDVEEDLAAAVILLFTGPKLPGWPREYLAASGPQVGASHTNRWLGSVTTTTAGRPIAPPTLLESTPLLESGYGNVERDIKGDRFVYLSARRALQQPTPPHTPISLPI
jgi:hypothetical protein